MWSSVVLRQISPKFPASGGQVFQKRYIYYCPGRWLGQLFRRNPCCRQGNMVRCPRVAWQVFPKIALFEGRKAMDTQAGWSPAPEQRPELSAPVFPGTPSEFIPVLAHYHRAEIARMAGWRDRIDRTTNWAITVVGA